MPYQFFIKLPVDIIGQNIIKITIREIILYFFSPSFLKMKVIKNNKYKKNVKKTTMPPSDSH